MGYYQSHSSRSATVDSFSLHRLLYLEKNQPCHHENSILFKTFSLVLLQACLPQAESDKITSPKLWFTVGDKQDQLGGAIGAASQFWRCSE